MQEALQGAIRCVGQRSERFLQHSGCNVKKSRRQNHGWQNDQMFVKWGLS